MKVVRFSQPFMHVVAGASVELFHAGQDVAADHPHYAEAQRCVARGVAEEVDLPDPTDPTDSTPIPHDAIVEQSETGAPDPDPSEGLADALAGSVIDPAPANESAASDVAAGAVI